MKYSNKLRLLLDSTYLLPIIGVEVKGIHEALLILRKLRGIGKLEAYYTPFNIIEIIGKISKIKYDKDIVYQGLTLIEEEFILTSPTLEGYMKALELKSKGFQDLIDLLLYTTALTRNLKLLTRDTILINFLEKQGENTNNILYEKELINKYGNLSRNK